MTMVKGSVAIDPETGRLGVIVDERAGVCVGFSLPRDGRGWRSSDPLVVGTVLDWTRSRKSLEEWVDEMLAER